MTDALRVRDVCVVCVSARARVQKDYSKNNLIHFNGLEMIFLAIGIQHRYVGVMHTAYTHIVYTLVVMLAHSRPFSHYLFNFSLASLH